MARVSLRQGLDRDVYQLVRKLEDEQEREGAPARLTITLVYDYIRSSNSSLGRLKRKPLEDSIERVLKFRKQDLQDQDSDAAIEDAIEPSTKPAGDLLNRQLARRWKLAEKKDRLSEQEGDQDSNELSDKMSGSKKRRLSRSPSAMANGDRDATEPQPKPSLAPRRARVNKGYNVVTPSVTPPLGLGGISTMVADFEKYIWPQMVQYEDTDEAMDGHAKPRGAVPLLLSGPLGCGKSSLLEHLASRWKVPILKVDCEYLANSDRSEKSMSDVYDEAVGMAPCIVQVNEVEVFWQSQGSSHAQPVAAASHVMQLLRRLSSPSLRDPRRPIAVAVTTSHPEVIPPKFFKERLVEETYRIKPPNEATRLEIIQALAESYGCPALDFVPVARATHGFVADDLHQLIKKGLRLNDSTGQPLTTEHLTEVAKGRVPHLRREGFSEIPDVTLDQVGGLREVINLLDLNIINRIKYPNSYKNVKKYAGILLWGPPGCGKTMVAQAIANAAHASFILVNGPELLDKYVGESERKIRALFERARASAPCLIFLDEIDSLVPHRENTSTEAGTRVVNTILTELDGATDRTGVYVIGATNRPDMIDPAMFRTGRFNHKVFIDVPGEEERVDILRTIFRSRGIQGDATIVEDVARDPRCANFSGADLSELSDRAVLECVKQLHADGETEKMTRGEVVPTREHWEAVLRVLRPSVRNLEKYRALALAEDLGVE